MMSIEFNSLKPIKYILYILFYFVQVVKNKNRLKLHLMFLL